MGTECQYKKVNKQRIFHWEYDDRLIGYIQCGPKGRKSHKSGIVKNEKELKELFKKDQENKPKFDKLHILGGIDQNSWDIFDYMNIDRKAMREGLEELEKMLASFTKKESEQTVWNLFSYIMAGYVARYLNHKTQSQSLYFYRAPIVHIIGHKKDICAGFEHLQRFVESLVVDTSRDGDLIMENPTVIPTSRFVEQITDCAYMVYSDDKKDRVVPTQYRDTAVLLHPYFFAKKDWEEFIHRNPWATVLVFNEKLSDKFQLVQRVDLNELALPDWDWDIDKVNGLIQTYVQWLSFIQRSVEYKKRWYIWRNVAVNTLFRYELANAKNGIARIQGSEAELKLLQITAIFALLDFFKQNEIVSVGDGKNLCRDWFKKLLGWDNCFPERISQAEAQYKKEQDENEKLLQEFKDTIKYILETEDCKLVKYVPNGKLFADSDAVDIENGPCAYLRMQKKGKTEERFRAVWIRKDELVAFGKRTGLLEKGAKVGRVKEKCNGKTDNPFDPDDIHFIYRFDGVRFKFKKCSESSHKNAVPGLILHFDELSFLDKDKWAKLKNMFPDME